MKINNLIDFILSIGLVVLVIIFFIPERNEPEQTQVVTVPKIPRKSIEQTDINSTVRYTTDEVSALFIHASPAMPPAAPHVTEKKAEVKPETVPWLHYVAFIVDETGTKKYFLKNDTNGRILSVSEKNSTSGWTLKSVENESLILEDDGHQYSVSMR
jgi:hypothetical protein